MAGHSKWANIKHKKAAADAKRGKVFSKYVKKISSAARRGGGDLDTNPELRLLVDKARAVNMPADNIDRAIKKATGQLEGVSYEEFSYEGYGPGGIAILVEGATDNRNRTVAEIRHAFSRHGGNMGENGCVNWMFEVRGNFIFEPGDLDIEALTDVAIENGATDVEIEVETVAITCEPGDFMQLRGALLEAGVSEFVSDEVSKFAQNTMAAEKADALQALKLIDYFEDHDDIENVYTNLELSDEVAAELENE